MNNTTKTPTFPKEYQDECNKIWGQYKREQIITWNEYCNKKIALVEKYIEELKKPSPSRILFDIRIRASKSIIKHHQSMRD